MNVIFKTGNVADEPAEGLVCSGNVELNMSGGVNGELLSRGGLKMQEELHDWLRAHAKRHVEPGFVIRIGPGPFLFKSIVYTVAVDGFHDSSIALVGTSLTNALSVLAEDGCRTVAVPALATGYGHLTICGRDFGTALRRCVANRDWPFSEIRVVLRSDAALCDVRSGYEAASPQQPSNGQP